MKFFTLIAEENVDRSGPLESEPITDYSVFPFRRDHSRSPTRRSSSIPTLTTETANVSYVENMETISNEPAVTASTASLISSENVETAVSSKSNATETTADGLSNKTNETTISVFGMESYTSMIFSAMNRQETPMSENYLSQIFDEPVSRTLLDSLERYTKKTEENSLTNSWLLSSPAAYSAQDGVNLTQRDPFESQPPTTYTSINDSVSNEANNSSGAGLTQWTNSPTTLKPTMFVIQPISESLLNAMNLVAVASKWSALVVSPFSLVTNGLSLCVFIRMYTRKQNIITILIIRCVVDTLSLIKRFSFCFQQYSLWFVLKGDPGCRGASWLMNVSQDWASWLSVIYTVERFVSVRWPMKVKVVCSRKRVLVAIVMSLMVSCVMEIYQILLRQGSSFSCTVIATKEALYSAISLAIHSFIGILLPYALIAVLNCLIIFRLIKQRSEHEQITHGGNSARENQRQRALTISLVTASSYSVIINIPMFIAILGDSIFGFPSVLDSISGWRALFDSFANDVISSWNYCGLFFFCVLAGKTFRQEFVRMVTCAKRDSSGKTACIFPNRRSVG